MRRVKLIISSSAYPFDYKVIDGFGNYIYGRRRVKNQTCIILNNLNKFAVYGYNPENRRTYAFYFNDLPCPKTCIKIRFPLSTEREEGTLQTFTLTDGNYSFPIRQGQLNFQN